MTALRDDVAAGPYWNLELGLRYTSESYWIWKITRVGREARSSRKNVGVVANSSICTAADSSNKSKYGLYCMLHTLKIYTNTLNTKPTESVVLETAVLAGSC